MATRLRTPQVPVSMPKRDVSPLGASKFEQPFVAARAPRMSTSTEASRSTAEAPDLPNRFSRPSDTSASTSPSTVDDVPLPYVKRSAVPPAQIYDASLSSTDDLSSVDRIMTELHMQADECDSDVCALPQDREAWFMEQTEEDWDLPMEERGDECPDGATLAAVQNIPLFDAEGNAVPFRSLWDPSLATYQRQLIIFVRYFYCGACQAFVKALTQGITMQDYFNIPTPTSIVLISCGKPDLIPQYRKLTNNCPFTILTEPTRELFKKLGMKWSMSLGPKRPDYMRDVSVMDVVRGQVRDIGGALRDADGIRKRDVFRGGNLLQIGGEFLFEDGEVIWCHRMRNMRGHAEIAMLRKLLELDPR